MLMEKLEQFLEKNKKQTIILDVSENNSSFTIGQSKFEGDPDLPKGFVWPYAVNPAFDEDEEEPLSFIAQLDLKEASKYDSTGLLPKTGYLHFFFAPCSDREDDGTTETRNCMRNCIKVFYFDCTADELVPTPMPEDSAIFNKITPCMPSGGKAIRFSSGLTYPSVYALVDREYEEDEEDLDYVDLSPEEEWELDKNFDQISSSLIEQHKGYRELYHHMFGYDEYLQWNPKPGCEDVYRGLYGNDVPDSEWLVLLQYAYVENAVHFIFYIRKDDLEAHRFDRVWVATELS